jgi:hypothetical protein
MHVASLRRMAPADLPKSNPDHALRTVKTDRSRLALELDPRASFARFVAAAEDKYADVPCTD